ncbi:MAG: hypothetical protein HW395_259 [candidate division NC10 bacterium]|nr:hypothetical protein [candidate division NC10 bacterium]
MTIAGPEGQASNGRRRSEADLPPASEIFVASILLAGLLLVFFLTPIIRHEVLSPADLLLKSEPWRQTVAPDFEPANSLLSDYVYQYRPWRPFSTASIQAGRVPLWNPHSYAGVPFLGNGESAVFYPLNLLFLVFPEATAVLLWAMMRLFIAGLAAYVFARVIGLNILGAGIASLGFAFSGFLVVWLLCPHTNVAIWLPALFLAAEAIIRRPTIFRTIALAVIVCIQFLGGHPETSLHILSAVALYVCWRAGMLFREESDWRRLAHRLAAFSGALILGTAGAAVQLVPLGENILGSAMLRERIALAPPFWFLPRPRLLAMVALACPYCFGSHLRSDLPLGVLLGVGNFNELNGGYVGLISLALVGIAIALGARRGLDLFFLLLGGLTFCVAYAIPPVFNLIHALPLFRVSANTRLLLLLAFALSVLAGRGADLLMTAPEERLRRMLRRTWKILIAGMAGVAIVSAGCLVTVLSFREKILEEAKARIVAKAGKGPFQQGPDPYLALLPRYYDRLVRLLVREGAGRVLLLGLTGFAISLAVRQSRGRRSLTWTLPGVLILDLFSFGWNYNPSIPAELEYPSHGAIDFLRRQPGLFRVLALHGGLPPNSNMMYGLSEIRGYSALETERYHRFLAATGDYPQPVQHFRTLYFSNFESVLIDLLNVKYLISDRELQHSKLTLVWQDGARVYENRSVLPRAFLVYRTQVLRNGGEAARALRDPNFDPSDVVLLEEEGAALSGPVDPAPTVRISDYQPERVVVEASSRYDGILILADSWFPGWKATVNGIPVKILRGNLLLRAVPIPAGHHQVIFRYDPLSFRLGAIVSGLALFIAASLVIWELLPRRRRGEKPL